MEPRSTDLIVEFLRELWHYPDTETWGEIRTISKGHNIGQAFLRLSEIKADSLRELALTRDVYFGVLPRLNPKGDAQSVVPRTRYLWGDFDKGTSAFSRFLTRAEKPHIIVDSGNGQHVYWKLDGFYPFEDARLAMEGMSIMLGIDKAYDAARILRLPDTYNHKNPKWDIPPRPVRLLKWDMHSDPYPLSRFGEYIYIANENRGPKVDFGTLDNALVPGQTRPRYPVPEWLADLIRKGEPKGQRSEAGFKVAISLLRRGWSPAEIREVFILNPNGIGEKYHERNMGDRWLKLTLQAASAALSSRP